MCRVLLLLLNQPTVIYLPYKYTVCTQLPCEEVTGALEDVGKIYSAHRNPTSLEVFKKTRLLNPR